MQINNIRGAATVVAIALADSKHSWFGHYAAAYTLNPPPSPFHPSKLVALHAHAHANSLFGGQRRPDNVHDDDEDDDDGVHTGMYTVAVFTWLWHCECLWLRERSALTRPPTERSIRRADGRSTNHPRS